MFSLLTTFFFSLYAIAHAVPSPLKRIVVDPPITSPDASTTWTAGSLVTVTWNTSIIPPEGVNLTGTLLLGYQTSDSENLDINDPLAQGFKLTDGSVQITVPNVVTRSNYIVVLMGDSGNASPEFTITGSSSSSSTSSASSATTTSVASNSPTTTNVVTVTSSEGPSSTVIITTTRDTTTTDIPIPSSTTVTTVGSSTITLSGSSSAPSTTSFRSTSVLVSTVTGTNTALGDTSTSTSASTAIRGIELNSLVTTFVGAVMASLVVL